MLREQRNWHLPFPLHLDHPSSWEGLPTEGVEALVHRLALVHTRWLLPRTQYLIPSHGDSRLPFNDNAARTIHSIDVFLDRWLLCIYQEKLVEMWDLDPLMRRPPLSAPCARQYLKGAGSFSSAMTRLQQPNNVLTIAVSW